MPELPEAETIARELHAVLAGRTLGRVSVTRDDIVHGDPRPLEKLLPGRRVVRVHRRAKRVILDLHGGMMLVVHLGMSGRLTVQPSRSPIEKHTHLRVGVRGLRQELRFRDPRRFGGVWCLTGSDAHVGKRLGPLGVEPLEMTPRQFRRLCARRRQIKALLLDQTVIAGLGNIYCDEALYAARIHPLRPADSLTDGEPGRLVRAIRSTLNRAIRFRGSTLMDYRGGNGKAGSFQTQHRAYQRAGLPCKRCGGLIERIVAAGRSTFYCPACQPRITEPA